MNWEQTYDFLGVKEYIYLISSPAIQKELFPIKLVFIFFALFFLAAIIYFYINSTYIKYKFLQDMVEFFSWQPYGLREVDRRWKKIIKKTEGGSEHDYKLALIEADDFLYQVLEERGFEGETFEELAESAGRRMLQNYNEIMAAHKIRNSVVYEPDYVLDMEKAKEMLSYYESAIKNISVS